MKVFSTVFNWFGKRKPGSKPTTRRRNSGIPRPINKYYIPHSVIEETREVMTRFGREQRECYFWWGGYFTSDGNAQVVTAFYPEIDTEFGHIHLTNFELTALHLALRNSDQVLLIELHTHPPMAGGQNAVDAAHPAATYQGFISIVVPDFGQTMSSELTDTYVYEYQQKGDWRQLSKNEIKNRFVVERTIIPVEP